MTVVGAGGVEIDGLQYSPRFKKEFKKAPADIQERVADVLRKLVQKPRPGGIGFEKLKGYSDPDIYTIHATGNWKISMSIQSTVATLRRVAKHDQIDRCP